MNLKGMRKRFKAFAKKKMQGLGMAPITIDLWKSYSGMFPEGFETEKEFWRSKVKEEFNSFGIWDINIYTYHDISAPGGQVDREVIQLYFYPNELDPAPIEEVQAVIKSLELDKQGVIL